MAIVVLVLWLFTAGAGFYLLVTSNLGRARPAATTPAAESATVPASAAAPPRRPRQPQPPPSRPPSPPRQAVPHRRLPRSARCGGPRGTGLIRPR
jgi:hypothetical protein